MGAVSSGMGTELTVDGRPVRYFPAGELVAAGDGSTFDRLRDRQLAEHPRVRRFLLSWLPGRPELYNLFHWSDGTELAGLDERVAAGTVAEEDFANALVVESIDLVCPECNAQYWVAEVASAMPVFAATRARRIREHTLVTACPTCGNKRWPLVTEVFDRADGPCTER